MNLSYLVKTRGRQQWRRSNAVYEGPCFSARLGLFGGQPASVGLGHRVITTWSQHGHGVGYEVCKGLEVTEETTQRDASFARPFSVSISRRAS